LRVCCHPLNGTHLVNIGKHLGGHHLGAGVAEERTAGGWLVSHSSWRTLHATSQLLYNAAAQHTKDTPIRKLAYIPITDSGKKYLWIPIVNLITHCSNFLLFNTRL